MKYTTASLVMSAALGVIVVGASVAVLQVCKQSSKGADERSGSEQRKSAKMKVAPYSQIVELIKSGVVSQADVPSDPAQQTIVEYQRKELRQVEAEFGRSIKEIFGHEGTVDERKLFRALHLICSAKASSHQALTETESMILSLHDLESEVNNGGFHQYFFNSAGDNWSIALRAMEQAGDSDAAVRFQRALAVFPGGQPSRDRRTRWGQLDALGEKAQFTAFDAADRDYFKSLYPDMQKTCRFLRSNQHEIKPYDWPNNRVQ